MRKFTFIMAVGILGALTIGQGQCNIEWPLPPFDASGVYTGLWRGTSNEAQAQVIDGCPLTLMLEQDLTANYPTDHAVKGTAEIDYSCIQLPEWANEIPASTVQVGGLLGDDGKLVLLSGGCTTALCVVLSLDGQGTDDDGDGLMDTYAGAWGYTILLAGVQPFGVTGTFEVAVAP